MWEGWLEFVPVEAGQSKVIVSAIESRQPERQHLEYLNPVDEDISWMSDDQLVTFIVVAVEAQLLQRLQ